MRQPSISKLFFTLSLITALLFVFFSGVLLDTSIQQKVININQQKAIKVSLSTQQIIQLFEVEVPLLNKNMRSELSTVGGNGNKLFNLFSLFSLKRPDTWLKQEIPVFSLVKINNNQAIEMPMESTPSQDFLLAEQKKEPEKQPDKQPAEKGQAIPTTGGKKVVFIYHTHNRESFLPELKTKKINEAYHPTINITNVGEALGKELEKLGIGAEISTKDYWPELESYPLSYKHSLRTVTAALSENRDLKFVFDIHRDGGAGGKDKTTRKINGVNYGAIYFIIGEGNKNYQQNKEFASKIHDSLEKLYPGISKGIWEKKKTSGQNGEYNQSVSPNSVTIEIGGVYNTLEEEYRAAKALADAIADVYWQAEKVNGN